MTQWRDMTMEEKRSRLVHRLYEIAIESALEQEWASCDPLAEAHMDWMDRVLHSVRVSSMGKCSEWSRHCEGNCRA